MSIYGIIRAPYITEKSSRQPEGDVQVVTLQVRKDANKHQIKEAVEKLFNVKVAQVRTANFLGKIKRQGRTQGRRPNWKKASVTLEEGHKIEFFEGV